MIIIKDSIIDIEGQYDEVLADMFLIAKHFTGIYGRKWGIYKIYVI